VRSTNVFLIDFDLIQRSYVPNLVKSVHKWRHNLVHRCQTDGQTDNRGHLRVNN